ncbi:GNAT family N-acetyltransferase [Pseudonocardia abyssalis]|uniref:GNAT family N-acetyltransferase n=1 Tax=Pseudonocardia abyssalis TaxID=2792008 RepID=A0ABS6UT47_9PSEU|nr:GNAT family N-acetyltransferase [Pseudonocardia abyssalis]MBW0114612.1 GNAT family N-acetyltransferase [Pseudonocardia abyssalis]MBW0135429.1 GNAT family N-acetyltransferase [Pseudonocardia abyssalis]
MAIAAVRAATPADVDEIVRIQGDTWEAAYSTFVPASAVDALRSDGARDAWASAVDADAAHVLVATEGDWTVGFLAAAAMPPEGAATPDQAWGEIGALLVEPRWGRRGHAGRLLATAAERLRGAGALYGLAWVPEPDEASRRFYARAGWEADGGVRGLDTGAGTLREIRLTGSLDLKLD